MCRDGLDVEAKPGGRQTSQEEIVRPVWANYTFRATRARWNTDLLLPTGLANGITYVEIQPCRTVPFRATVIADKAALDFSRRRAEPTQACFIAIGQEKS